MKNFLKVGLFTLLILITITSVTFAQLGCTTNQVYYNSTLNITVDGTLTEWASLNTGSPEHVATVTGGTGSGAEIYAFYRFTQVWIALVNITTDGNDQQALGNRAGISLGTVSGGTIIADDAGGGSGTLVAPARGDGWEGTFTLDPGSCDTDYFVYNVEKGDATIEGTFKMSIDAALAVELSSFTAENLNGQVVLKWTTESEIENQGFILERREADIPDSWQEIASFLTHNELEGQGTVTYSTNYVYVDKLVQAGHTYKYRLADVDYNSVVEYHNTVTVIVEENNLSGTPEKFTVKPAYPNPFNPSTTIRYGLNIDSRVTVEIYDILGKLISTLINTEQSQGWHSVIWNGTNKYGEQTPAGLYLSKITSGNEVKTAKLMLLK